MLQWLWNFHNEHCRTVVTTVTVDESPAFAALHPLTVDTHVVRTTHGVDVNAACRASVVFKAVNLDGTTTVQNRHAHFKVTRHDHAHIIHLVPLSTERTNRRRAYVQ